MSNNSGCAQLQKPRPHLPMVMMMMMIMMNADSTKPRYVWSYHRASNTSPLTTDSLPRCARLWSGWSPACAVWVAAVAMGVWRSCQLMLPSRSCGASRLRAVINDTTEARPARHHGPLQGLRPLSALAVRWWHTWEPARLRGRRVSSMVPPSLMRSSSAF